MQLIALEQLLVIYRLVPFKNEREIFKKKGETLTNGFVQVLTVAISFAFSLYNAKLNYVKIYALHDNK